MSREDAYRVVQRNAMAIWREGGQLKDRLRLDPDVDGRLSGELLDEIFDIGYHTAHVDLIFKKVFKD
jgi:adenylosuccinate lyase